MINVGDKAPEFTELKKHVGKNVVLYFYPKDDTPGCTIEACGLRDSFPKFGQLNAVILGVSPDSAASHEKFRQKFNLPFTLVPDEDKSISQAYGVWAEKSMMGRKYMGVNRTTFIIDPQGRITKIFEKVKPQGHEKELLSYLNCS